MAVVHAYIDESVTSSYLLCAAVVDTSDVHLARKSIQLLRRAGQRRIHMTKESRNRRLQIAAAVGELPISVHIATAPFTSGSPREARDACFRQLVRSLWLAGVTRLVVESCGQDRADRQVIGDVLARLRAIEDLDIVHLSPAEEPMLWAADALAWVHTRGGADHRTAIAKLPLHRW